MADDLRRNLGTLLHGLVDAWLDGREPMWPGMAEELRRRWGTDPGIWDQLHAEAQAQKLLRPRAVPAPTPQNSLDKRAVGITAAKRAKRKPHAFLTWLGDQSVRGFSAENDFPRSTLQAAVDGRRDLPDPLKARLKAMGFDWDREVG